ncbi:MAG: glycosyl transferase [Clostridia bacterium]|nr:glycosyl transferase [Clostridia bacterium]
MIPKIIHYIWLGENPLPKIAEKCIESWKKFCPGYKIKRWDESNLNLDKYDFVKDALKAKKYAFASDVLRTEVLYNEGGIYLDIDVELIKPIEQVLHNHDCVMGFETSNLLNPGLFIASPKDNKDLKNILNIYQNLKFDVNNLINLTVCEIYTKYYEQKGLNRENKTQQIDNTIFYASEYFSPIDVVTNRKKITCNTYSIHWYNASWYTGKQKLMNKIKKVANIFTFGLAGKIWNKVKK